MRRRHFSSSTFEMIVNELNSDEKFILKRCVIYLIRHLKKFSNIEKETLSLVCWILGENIEKIADFFIGVNDERYGTLEADFIEADPDPDDYGELFFNAYKKSEWKVKQRFRKYLQQLLERQESRLSYKKLSGAEKTLFSLGEMFKMTTIDMELCVFMFIVKAYTPPEMFFDYHLECFKFRGRKYLLNMLEVSASQLQETLIKLKRYEIVDIDSQEFDLSSDFLEFLQNPDKKDLTRNFFSVSPGTHLPLNAHFIHEKKLTHIKCLLKVKPKSSTHLIFYGPPGTGKTSLARRLGRALKLPTYEISKNEGNKASTQRSAIVACINMTNTGDGSLIIVDEADNLINTSNPWMFGGETHDKGWLNHLLEIPETRVIWITNNIDNMEESVQRRFAFSLRFKKLNRKQRVLLWDRLLRQNRIKRHFDWDLISDLASKYKVSAGVIDMAIKKAVESGIKSKTGLIDAIELGIDAHLELIHGGQKKLPEKNIENNFTLAGLNVRSDIHFIIKQTERFNAYLHNANDELKHQMTLLLYGPPGTGKSELARYFGSHLERKLHFKRFSELQSKWVGEGEKNIRAAFEEAENEKAILVIDEIDSVLFSRDRAQKSWEISFTNEFLTAMERFRSLLICTTNRLKDLDSAAIRRFTYKVEFDLLTPNGNRIFFNRMLKSLTKTPLDRSQNSRLEQISDLAPGDFKTVQNKYAFYPTDELNNILLLDALEEEARIKNLNKSRRKVGF